MIKKIAYFLLTLLILVFCTSYTIYILSLLEKNNFNHEAKTDNFYIHINSRDKIGLAVFERGKYLWIIADKYQDSDIDKLREQSKGFLDEIMIIPNSQHLIMRIRTEYGISPSIKQTANGWMIIFGHRDYPAPKSLYVMDIGTESVLLSQLGRESIITITDPEIGDEIMVIPDKDFGYGFYTNDFIDFQTLPSIQGLALTDIADEIFFEQDDASLTIKSKSGKLWQYE